MQVTKFFTGKTTGSIFIVPPSANMGRSMDWRSTGRSGSSFHNDSGKFVRLTNLPLLLLFFNKEIHRCLAEVKHVRRMTVGVSGDGNKVHGLRQPYLYMYRSVFLIGK